MCLCVYVVALTFFHMPVLKTTRKAPSFYFGLFALLLVISIFLSFQVKSMHMQILSKRYADQDWFYVLAHRSNMHFVADLFSEGITAHFPAAFFQDAQLFVPHTHCTNQFVLAYFNEINPPLSQAYYQWSGGDHVFFPQGESSTWFQTKGPLSYTTNVHVSAQNICGSNILTQLLTVQECGGGGIPPVPPASDPETPLLVISPNPASDYIDVSINNFSQQLQDNEVYVMTIYDRFSQPVRNVTTDVPHVRIPVYNLPTGVYVLSVVSGDQVRLHGKFIIQR